MIYFLINVGKGLRMGEVLIQNFPLEKYNKLY